MSQSLFNKAVELFDAANSEDPNIEIVDGNEVPKELLYSQRMSNMIDAYMPDADDVAKLSVRAQHIQRWKSPRKDYPMNRKGYHLWRTNLYKFHSETAANFLKEAGYEEGFIERVKLAVAKKSLKTNSDTQIVEDVAALVFLQFYMLAFYQKFSTEYDEDKWVDIILRTWKKMSPQAHEFALSEKLTLPESLVPLIQKALEG
ncbi:MAG TPA: DUF4202 domain-containing protein [Leucothrix mucor]|nr:DUF4202 domain-containing protein [Leucothrix mucor]